MIQVGIGEIGIAMPPEELRTVLGSCIAILIYDPEKKIAGMAHVMLPSGTFSEMLPGKYADTAVRELIQRMIRKGAVKSRMRVKITGGASMFSRLNLKSSADIGKKNAEAVELALKKEGLRILKKEIGGTCGRRVVYSPETGQAEISGIDMEEIIL